MLSLSKCISFPVVKMILIIKLLDNRLLKLNYSQWYMVFVDKQSRIMMVYQIGPVLSLFKLNEIERFFL